MSIKTNRANHECVMSTVTQWIERKCPPKISSLAFVKMERRSGEAGLTREDLIDLSAKDLAIKLREVGLPISLTEALHGKCCIYYIFVACWCYCAPWPSNFRWFVFNNSEGDKRSNIATDGCRRYKIRTERPKCWRQDTSAKFFFVKGWDYNAKFS